jgi:hypothetical protein
MYEINIVLYTVLLKKELMRKLRYLLRIRLDHKLIKSRIGLLLQLCHSEKES